MKILLVEPDRILASATIAILRDRGHIITWCRSAQSALDALDNDLPELIILEPQLGIHNGIEFLYEIRSYPEWQAIPVIVYTINAKARDQQFAKPFTQLGVLSVAYKPQVNLARLCRLIERSVQIV